MSQGLYFNQLVKGIIDPKVIDEKGKFNFLVTFKTRAYEDGHVLWLRREFEDWLKEIKKIPGVLDAGQFMVKKAKQKSGFGSIELSITVAGGIKMASDFNTVIAGNVVAAMRKSYAEIILQDYTPGFDYREPLFYAIHDHCYQATHCCSDWTKGKRRLNALQAGHQELKWQFDACGAILKEVQISGDNNDIRMVMRWKFDANENQRDTLEKVIKAYFAGLGFTLASWQCNPLEN